VQRLLRDNLHVAREKFDGRRLLLRKEAAAIDGINRKGLVVGLPEPVFQAFYRFPGDCVLDGESVGDVFNAFDLLNCDGQDIRAR
jgi:bifunctional non-homologous end joining protein LigD